MADLKIFDQEWTIQNREFKYLPVEGKCADWIPSEYEYYDEETQDIVLSGYETKLLYPENNMTVYTVQIIFEYESSLEYSPYDNLTHFAESLAKARLYYIANAGVIINYKFMKINTDYYDYCIMQESITEYLNDMIIRYPFTRLDKRIGTLFLLGCATKEMVAGVKGTGIIRGSSTNINWWIYLVHVLGHILGAEENPLKINIMNMRKDYVSSRMTRGTYKQINKRRRSTEYLV